MPPAISDDERSEAESQAAMPTSRSRKSKSIDYKERVEVDEDDDVVMVERPKSSKKPVAVDTAEDDEDEDEDDDEEEEEDDELGDGEYIVEKILNHRVDKGVIRYNVKWEGYEDPKDRTWEPEENLREAANEILDDYLASQGGRAKIMEDSSKALKKRRGRPSTSGTGSGRGNSSTPSAAATNGAGTKRTKRSTLPQPHPADGTPPASAAAATARNLPAGSWEDRLEISGVHVMPGTGKLWVMVEWKEGGWKTQHAAEVLYKRCPQKMLRFYESRVIISDQSSALEAGKKEGSGKE